MHFPGVSLSASFRSEGAAKHQGVPCLPGECLGVSLGQMQCLGNQQPKATAGIKTKIKSEINHQNQQPDSKPKSKSKINSRKQNWQQNSKSIPKS